jgi:hypothetical protein
LLRLVPHCGSLGVMKAATGIAILLVGVCIGAGFTMALGFSEPVADAGDWLAFTGALVGVVVTILGTLMLEAYRAGSEERKQRKILLTTLDEFSEALRLASLPRGNDPTEVARPGRLASERQLLSMFTKFMYARNFIPHHDIGCWQALEDLYVAMGNERQLIADEVDALHQAGENEAVLLTNVQNMQGVAQRLQPHLTKATKEARD